MKNLGSTPKDGATSASPRVERSPELGLGPCDAEFLHAVAQCVGVEAEDLGGAAGAVDDPVGLLENGEDVVALHGSKGLAHRTRCGITTIVGLTSP